MGFFDFFRGPDINQEMEAYYRESNAVLLDVRTPEEYWAGHIPGSRNLPLDALDGAEFLLGKDRDVPVYVYCHSGSRSRQAASLLGRLGYRNVKNMGIAAWKGEVER